MMSDDMKGCKGLGLPVVALPGLGHRPAKGEDEQKAARVFYLVATQRLVIGVRGVGGSKAAEMAINPKINRPQLFPAINTQSFKVPRNS